MKQTIFALTIFLFTFSGSFADQVLTLKIGPHWPRDIYKNHDKGERTSWDAAFEFGRLFDNRFTLGGSIDFSWYSLVKDSSYDSASSTVTDINAEEKCFMFPASMFLAFDPVPHLIVHPLIKGKFGCNMAAYIHKQYPQGKEEKLGDNGFYIGFFGSASINAVYDMGESVSVFAGFEYQWTKIRKHIKMNQYIYKKMYGPGIRMGMRFIF